jgi:hypothetical protein
VNWGMSERGQCLVEIELSEVCIKPRIERTGANLKVVTSSTIGIDQILSEFGHLMHPQEKIDVVKLWRDDNIARNFKEVKGSLMISFKEMV